MNTTPVVGIKRIVIFCCDKENENEEQENDSRDGWSMVGRSHGGGYNARKNVRKKKAAEKIWKRVKKSDVSIK